MTDTDNATGAEVSSRARWGRVEVHSGGGMVHRGDDMLVVIPAVEVGSSEQAVRLLEAATAGPDPTGRRRFRRLAWLLAEAEPGQVPGFAFLVRDGEAVRVMAHGDVTVRVRGGEGDVSFSGAESLAWVERTVPASFDTLSVSGTTESEPPPPEASLPFDLVAGTVPGGGVTLRRVVAERAATSLASPAESPAGSAAESAAGSAAESAAGSAAESPGDSPSESPAESPAKLLTRPTPAAVEATEGQTVLRATPRIRLVPLSRATPGRQRPRRPALPVGPPATDPATAGQQAKTVMVTGVICHCGQVNDPESDGCSACGAPLDRGQPPVTRARPPLGVLITDDGRVFTVTGDVVIGREPAQAPDVREGRAQPLVLQDDEHSTSRVHAVLRLDGWTVLASDAGSANGTSVSRGGPAGPWVPVLRAPPTPLQPGDRLRLGKRQLLFDRHHELRTP